PRSTAELPPGWRPEWRPPKSKPAPAAPAAAAPPAAESAARRRARAREERLRQAQTDVTKSLPSRADLFERGVRTLWEIAGDVGEEAKDGTSRPRRSWSSRRGGNSEGRTSST